MMNGKKERELLVVGLERLLHTESKMTEDYRALAEMLDGIRAGVLLDWVVIEEEAHHTLLINILHSLKQTAQGHPTGADDVEMARETMLCWIKRLRTKEQTVVADCRSLKNQAWWETGDLVDAFIDAVIMDSEKHQGFLLAVEKAIDSMMMSRPQ